MQPLCPAPYQAHASDGSPIHVRFDYRSGTITCTIKTDTFAITKDFTGPKAYRQSLMFAEDFVLSDGARFK